MLSPIPMIFRPLVAVVFATTALHAQDTPAAPSKPTPIQRSLSAIEAQLPVIDQEQQRLNELRDILRNKAGSEEEKADVRAAITERRARIEKLENNIRSLASGVPEDAWSQSPSAPKSLQDELRDALQPALDSFRSATSGPREISKLREDIDSWENRLAMAEQALKRLSTFPAEKELESKVAKELSDVRQLWENRRTEANGELEALRTQLAQRESNEKGFVETFSDGVSKFWRTKGFNLLLAITVFVLVLFVGRRGLNALRRHSPLHKKDETPVYARLIDLLAGVLIGLFAAFASLLVLYFRGDWLLLSIAIVLLVAIALASRNSILPYADQIRTILNLGPVREGERIVIDGVPWRVDTLGFYCGFSNPMISATSLRLPIKEVIGLRSRPLQRKEPWFPTGEDDWAILSDGTFGKVVTQTPETVVVLQLGGSRKTYPVGDFLSLAPENLSKGFRVSVTFGIDYAHQAICTTEVPEIFAREVHRALASQIDHEQIKSVQAEFASAGASSLDYAILADFDGEAARRYNQIHRAIQKACVDVCNEQGWIIPFTQITVHQAPED